MTVIVPDLYHAKDALVEHNITCISKDAAQKQDIRPLRIGILNIMPNVQNYEFNLLYPLGKSILQIYPVWIKLDTHAYASSAGKHMDTFYISFAEAIREKPLDGLILTGAPVEELSFDEINYWDEITDILNYAQSHFASTLGICWGAMALAKVLNIDKVNFEKKLFGVYRTRNLNSHHPITGDLDDYFNCPQSRHAGYSDELLEKARDSGQVNLLAHSVETGYTIIESIDKKFLMHLGHPEYNSGRLVEEYWRDKKSGRTDVNEPVNFNVENPVNTWRSHRNEFFSQWLKYIYLTTSY